MLRSIVAWVVAALQLHAWVSAAPVEHERRDVTAAVFEELVLFSQYSAAAYCSADNDNTGGKVSCKAGNCPLVEAAGATSLFEFSNIGFGGVTGLLVVDTVNKLVVLSFRGTDSLLNWLDDIDAVFTDVNEICSGCEAHNGWWTSWLSVKGTLTPYIDSAISNYAGYRLVFTGHSLGAALATLGAADLRVGGYNIDLYSYGCPRPGNKALANYLTTESGGTNYRVTHSDDIVPKVPPESFGFSHYSPEYWITSATNAPVTTSDITIVVGVDSQEGNAGTGGFDVAAHRWYFGPISSCT